MRRSIANLASSRFLTGPSKTTRLRLREALDWVRTMKNRWENSPAIDAYTVHMYNVHVILTFADQATEDLYHGRNTKAARKIDRRIWQVAFRKLDILNAAASLADLKSPGNQLEKLKGELVGLYSVRVNDQYRIVFRFQNGNAMDVRCIDVH